MPHYPYLIVGGGMTADAAVRGIRELDPNGAIGVLSAEADPPYARPPLTKALWKGEPLESVWKWTEQAGAEMHLRCRAVSIDLRAKRVALADGTFADYDRLIIATGARVRTLPAIAPRTGLFTLRGLDDAIVLRRALMDAPRVAIVGAGFIGLEVAASCRARGLPVTVIESLPVPLSPIVGPTIGDMVAAIHRDHGVDLRTGVVVTDVLGESRVAGVALSDGSRIDADVVVVGIGVTPNTEWLEPSGLTIDNGIVCNGSGEAAPSVYAAGDVARVANRWHGDSPRIEHWTNAVEQAVHAAENALAGPEASTSFSSVPYFWSDQYDRKIQFIGAARPHDEMVIIDGSLADRTLTALYRRDDRVVACLAVNQPRALIKYRKLLAAGASWDAALSGTAASYPA